MPYNRYGVHILLVEYPGYGRSAGNPSQETIEETFVAAYDWLLTRDDIDTSKILGHGRSIGGGAICLLAKQRALCAMILQSTFTSVRQFSRRYLVPGFLIRDPFDNVPIVKSFEGPILIIHGKDDTIIPYQNGVALYNMARDAKLITYDCAHNNCPLDWDQYWNDIEEFLTTHNV